MKEQHEHVLKHCLGMNMTPPVDRNYYAIAPDNPVLGEMVDLGLMAKGRRTGDSTSKLQFFHATDKGREAIVSNA